MRVVLLLIILVMGGRVPAAGQGPPVPGVAWLRAVVRAHPAPDTVRANRLNALALSLRTNAPAESAALFGEALALARRLRYPAGEAAAVFGLGYYCRLRNAYGPALAYTLRAQRLYKQLGDGFNQARCQYSLARIYFEQGNYGQSVAANLDGLALAKARHDAKGQAFLSTQLGITNSYLADYPQAQQYLARGLALARQGHDRVGMGHASSGLGDLYRRQGQWAQAQAQYEQALAAYRPVYNRAGLLFEEINLADMNERQGRYPQALAQAYDILARAHRADAVDQVPRAELVLARAYLDTDLPDSARRYAQQSLAASERSGARENGRDATEILARATAQLGRFADAYAYQQLYGAYSDSLTGEATRRRAAAAQFGYGRSQAQAQIRLLTEQARLQAQTQEVARLREQREMSGFGALAGAALLGAAGWRWRTRQRQHAREARLRTQIAADLHDDVGTLLSQISLQSSLLQEDLADPAAHRQQLGQIAEASRAAVRQLNDVVWSLDAHNDHLPQLLDRLRDYAYDVLVPAGLAVVFDAPAALPDGRLPTALRRNLYLIYKEALHNVLKHAAGATRVTVRLALGGSPAGLLLEVRDDAAVPAGHSHARRSGHGLRNMAERAAALGGTAAWEPLPGGGSAVRVALPLGA
ncbi:sensor histidine kinase [Hymenobacter caeli]|uniref:Signal transduction histidine kinase n=1 Tax=Hymenobacter caeli TaxID=2735894 RepID=A0ABX2FRS7_9BACT|nr:tetratricopeptide repeat protein [Hymenobacter caeli]NRT19533.1 signal transduction histidine kinase [Hymenobacter caeli]